MHVVRAVHESCEVSVCAGSARSELLVLVGRAGCDHSMPSSPALAPSGIGLPSMDCPQGRIRSAGLRIGRKGRAGQNETYVNVIRIGRAQPSVLGAAVGSCVS